MMNYLMEDLWKLQATKSKEKIKMKKSLFDRARDVQHGALESRMVARMETEGRPLTDDETITELLYLKDTLPYAGLEKEDLNPKIKAINYLLSTIGHKR